MIDTAINAQFISYKLTRFFSIYKAVLIVDLVLVTFGINKFYETSKKKL